MPDPRPPRSSLSRWVAFSDHPAASALRRGRRALLRFSVPVPHAVAKILLACFLACRTVIKFFIRIFVCEPAFKAYCSRYGRGLTTTTHLPWVQGRGRIVVGDDVRINGRIAIAFAARYSDDPLFAIGDGTSIGHNTSFVVGKRVSIGKGCLIANEVIVFDAPGHPVSAPLRRSGVSAPPESVKRASMYSLRRMVTCASVDSGWTEARPVVAAGVTAPG